jgi:hypothetical protein
VADTPIPTDPRLIQSVQLPTPPGRVDGIVSLDPPQVQCRGCGVIAEGRPGKLALLVMTCGIHFHLGDGREQRLCAECRSGCTCTTCRGGRRG